MLQSVNFDSARPTVLVVESVTPLTYELSHLAWESIFSPPTTLLRRSTE